MQRSIIPFKYDEKGDIHVPLNGFLFTLMNKQPQIMLKARNLCLRGTLQFSKCLDSLLLKLSFI